MRLLAVGIPLIVIACSSTPKDEPMAYMEVPALWAEGKLNDYARDGWRFVGSYDVHGTETLVFERPKRLRSDTSTPGNPSITDPPVSSLKGVPYKDFEGSRIVSNTPNRRGYAIGDEEQEWVRQNWEEVLKQDAVFESTPDGLKLADVAPGSVLEKRGFQSGDIILSVNGIKIMLVESLRAFIDGYKGQSNIVVVVDRSGSNVVLFYTLEAKSP